MRGGFGRDSFSPTPQDNLEDSLKKLKGSIYSNEPAEKRSSLIDQEMFGLMEDVVALGVSERKEKKDETSDTASPQSSWSVSEKVLELIGCIISSTLHGNPTHIQAVYTPRLVSSLRTFYVSFPLLPCPISLKHPSLPSLFLLSSSFPSPFPCPHPIPSHTPIDHPPSNHHHTFDSWEMVCLEGVLREMFCGCFSSFNDPAPSSTVYIDPTCTKQCERQPSRKPALFQTRRTVAKQTTQFMQ